MIKKTQKMDWGTKFPLIFGALLIFLTAATLACVPGDGSEPTTECYFDDQTDCEAFGCCWNGTCYIVDRAIADIAARVEPAALGEETNVTVTALAGTSICFFVDWGDNNTIEEMCYATYEDLDSFLFQQNDTGVYDITVWYENMRSFGVFSLAGHVDVELTGTFTSVQTVEADARGLYQITPILSAGTNFNINISYGDGSPEVMLFYSDVSDLPVVINYTYAMFGAYDVSVIAYNSLTSLPFTFTALYGTAITELYCTADELTALGLNTTYTITHTNGTQMHLVLSGGDEDYQSAYKLLAGSVTVFEHKYEEAGVFPYGVLAVNIFGNMSCSGVVVVQNPVAGIIAVDSLSAIANKTPYTLDFTIQNGTNATCTANIDGTEAGTVNYIFGETSGTVDFTGNEAALTVYGIKTINVTCCNLVNCESDVMDLKVIELVTASCSVNDTDISVNSITQVMLNITGSNINKTVISWDTGLEMDEETYANASVVPSPMPVTFVTMGIQQFGLNFCNELNCDSCNLTTMVGIPLRNWSVVTNSPLVVGETLITVLSLSNSSMVTCYVNYADSTWDLLYTLFSGGPLVFEKNYTDAGSYNLEILCENDFGNTSMDLYTTVYVQAPVTMVMFNEENMKTTTPGSITVSWTNNNATDVKCNVSVDGQAAIGQVFQSEIEGNITLTDSDYGDYGNKVIDIICFNELSNATNTTTLIVDRNITDLVVTAPEAASSVGDTIHVATGNLMLQANSTNGSRISYTFILGDGSANITSNFTDATIFESLSPTYSNPGYYIGELTAENSVSFQRVTLVIIVENPLPARIDVSISANDSVDPAFAVPTTISQSSGVQATSVMMDCDNGDGTVLTNVPVVLNTTTDFVYQTNYGTFGYHTQNCTMYNNVSTLAFSNNMTVGLATAGAVVTVELTVAAVSDPVTINAHVDEGTVEYKFDCGDGVTTVSPRTLAGPTAWVNADNTTAVCYYGVPSPAYQPSVTFMNALGDNVTLNASSTVEVQAKLEGLNMSAAEFVGLGSGIVVYDAFLDDPSNSPTGEVNCTWIYNDSTTEVVDGSNLTLGESVINQHTELLPGNINTSVTCANTMSQDTASVLVTMEREVFNPELIIQPHIATDATVLVTFTVQAGSHTTYTLSECNGTSIVLSHPVLLDNTSPVSINCQYTTSANSTLTLEASNDVSTENTSKDIIVQMPVSPCSLSSDPEIYVKRDGGVVVFTATTLAALDDVTSCFTFPDPYLDTCGFVGDNPGEFAFTFTINKTSSVGENLMSVNISNLVSFETCPSSFIIENEVIGVQLQLDPRSRINSSLAAVHVGVPASATVTVLEGTDVNVTADFGDGIIEATVSVTGEGANEVITHVYTEPGTYQVTGTAENHINSETSNATAIKAEHGILFTSLVVGANGPDGPHGPVINKTLRTADGLGGVVEFNFDTISGSPSPTDTLFTLSAPDRDEQYYAENAWPTTLVSSPFSTIGDIALDLTLENNVSITTWQMILEVMEEISLPAEALELPIVPLPFTEPFHMSLTKLTGTPAHLKIEAQQVVLHEMDIVGEGNQTLNFTFDTGPGTLLDKPGPQIINVNLSNAFGSEATTGTFLLIADLPNVTVVCPESPLPKLKEIPTNAACVIQLEKYYDMTVNLTLHFDDGDSTSEIVSIFNDIPFNHLFDSYGIYNITGVLSTPFDTKEFYVEFVTQEELEGCMLTVHELGKAEQDTYPTVFIIGANAVLNVTCTAGSGLMLNYMLTKTAPTPLKVTHHKTDSPELFELVTLTSPGEFRISVDGTNRINNVSFLLDITVLPFGIINQFIYESTINKNTDMDLIISIDKEMPEICVRYDVGAEKCWISPDLENCKKIAAYAPTDCFMLYGDRNSLTFSYNHKFTDLGFYGLQVTVYDAQSPDEVPHIVTGTVAVTMYCYSPVLKLKQQEDAFLTFHKSSLIDIGLDNFDIIIDCQATNQILQKWEVFWIPDPSQLYMVISQGEVDGRADGIEFAPNVFDAYQGYGMYYLEYTIAMGEAYTDLKASAGIHINIIESPLVALIEGGTFKQVSKDAQVRVDATSTHDPDDDTAALNVTWYCWKNDGPLLTGNEQAILIPDTKGSGGGCFGNGIGPISFSGSVLEFPAPLMDQAEYTIKIEVAKGNHTASAEQIIEVVSGEPPSLAFSCFGTNCLTKVNTGAISKFECTCSNCPPEGTSFSHKLFRKMDKMDFTSSITEIQQPDPTKSVYSVSDGLPEGHAFIFEVTAEPPPGSTVVKGRTQLVLHTDYKPWNGSCNIQPLQGTSTDYFSIECDGFLDDGQYILESGIKEWNPVGTLTYTYYTRVDFQSVEMSPLQISAGKPTLLPQGKPEYQHMIQVIVQIEDQFYSSIQKTFDVKVEPTNDSAAFDDIITTLQDTSPAVLLLDSDQSLSALLAAATHVQNGIDQLSGSLDATTEGTMLQEQQELALQETYASLIAVTTSLVTSLFPDSGTDMDGTDGTGTDGSGTNGTGGTGTLPVSLDVVAKVASAMSEMTKTFSEKTLPEAKTNALEFTVVASKLISQETDPTKRQRLMENTLNTLSSTGSSLPSEPQVESTAEEKKATVIDKQLTVAEEKALQAKAAEEEAKQRELAKKAQDAMKLVVKAIGSGLLASAAIGIPESLTSGGLEIVGVRMTRAGLMDTTLGASKKTGTTRITSIPKNNTAQMFDTVFSGNTANVYTTSATAAEIGDSTVMTLNIRSGDNNGGPLEGADIAVTQTHADDVEPASMSNATIDTDTDMMYQNVDVLQNFSAFVYNLTPQSDAIVGIDVYCTMNCTEIITCRPNTTHHDYNVSLPRSDVPANRAWRFTIPAERVELNIFCGFLFNMTESVPGSSRRRKRAVTSDDTVPDIAVKAGMPSCRAWDAEQSEWRSDTCNVDGDADLGTTTCDCSTSSNVEAYSGGFTMPTVNPIDFNKIFDNFAELLGDNPAVFIVVFGIIGVYVLLAIWARRYDKKDVEKWGVLPLSDNMPNATYFYKVSVLTGMRHGAGTKSRICFILTGDDGDTGVRILEDNKKRQFSSSSVRHFVLGTDQGLGGLTFLRIWHDNSGQSDSASWYLDKILVENLQTRDRYFFLCGQWFAVDEGDGLIDRILPVAGKEEIISFNHLFFDKTRRKLFDDHLWISLVGRPSRSNFTRLQRLTCILTLLYSTMIANMMWYGRADVKSDRTLRVGPIVLSAATVLVSIFGSLTVVPVNTIIMMLFRKTRPKDWPQDDEVIDVDGNRIKIQETQGAAKKKKWWKKKYPLPYWCAYIAWVVAILTTLTSAIFVIFYSLDWGKERSEEWLSSLFLSTVQSIVLVQPIKILFLAMIMALIFKTLDEDDEEGEKKENAKPKPDEVLTDENLIALSNLTAIQPPEPLTKKKLTKARNKRNYERRMWDLLKEATFYFLFLLLISFIVWGSKNPMLYRMNRMLLDEVSGGSLDDVYSDVTDGHKFWEWARDTMLPSLFYMFDYTDYPTTVGDRQYLSDGINYRVGPLRMRQLRITPGACDLLPVMKEYMIECNKGYSIFDEENRNFTLNWELDPISNYTEDDLTPIEGAFKYRGFFELKGLPYIGGMATYGGGGYVADLGIHQVEAQERIDELIKHNWIDYYTRGVFIQFTTFNAATNLFSYVNYLLEFPATGAIMPYPRVSTFQIYSVVSGMEMVILAAEILYMILIVVFMIREILKFRRERKQYFKDTWNIVQLIIIILSWVALAMFIMRELAAKIILSDISENKEEYTNFEGFGYYDEIYWYIIGTIVFMSNIKFLRLLRFNKHIAHFAGTLKYARVELLNFSVTFMILFLAFTSSGFLLFGRHMLDFHTVINVMESLYSMLIGKFDFREMEKADRLLGPIYFAFFMLLMFFVIINFFMGILGEAYEQVRLQPDLISDDHRVVDFIMEKMSKLIYSSKRAKETEVHYMEPMETLNKRLESLDRMVTEECRMILGLATQKQQRQNDSAQKSPKDTWEKDTKKKVGQLTFLTRLQQKSNKAGPGTSKQVQELEKY